ncbi:hypothetical protein COCHEDRAFT_1207130 [Bipolaris maydis C5]|uniref:Uncharacterized protein n=1 Tax=Cochliobolus heterostrophus (strain C5 / ATCC 48332 / race O) TaxID=701091 RepID=M2SMX0_COCH5|nr:hypothetical protein COCHEDRAFT_1207130 [Bipolaris maydis C5]KAJ6203723.1 hypothetical protein PSV09DRAFT_1207130 [Bipolaris maydis]
MRRHKLVQKLANAAERFIARQALHQNYIGLLKAANNESKSRRNTRSDILKKLGKNGEGQVMRQEELEAIRADRAERAERAKQDAAKKAVGFKNYAMGRIYAQHTATSFNTAVTTSDVEHACDNSAMHSKLREFYVAFVVTYFNNPNRIHGSAEEWDGFFLKCADMRLLLLQGFRLGDRDFLKSEGHYFDKDDKIVTRWATVKLRSLSNCLNIGYFRPGEISDAFTIALCIAASPRIFSYYSYSTKITPYLHNLTIA